MYVVWEVAGCAQACEWDEGVGGCRRQGKPSGGQGRDGCWAWRCRSAAAAALQSWPPMQVPHVAHRRAYPGPPAPIPYECAAHAPLRPAPRRRLTSGTGPWSWAKRSCGWRRSGSARRWCCLQCRLRWSALLAPPTHITGRVQRQGPTAAPAGGPSREINRRGAVRWLCCPWRWCGCRTSPTPLLRAAPPTALTC